MNSAPAMLLAALNDLIQVWAPIIFVVLYGVAQIVGGFQEQQRKARQRKRVQPPPPRKLENAPPGAAPPNKAPPGKQPTLEETLRREVDEFLRRAQGQPAQPPQAKKIEPPKREQPQGPRQEPQARRPLAPPANRDSARQGRTEDRRPEPLRRMRESVASTAKDAKLAPPAFGSPLPRVDRSSQGQADARRDRSMARSAVPSAAEPLGDDVHLADERMEQHLRESFEHQIGAITHVEPTAEKARRGSPAAEQLRKMLSEPGGARQLIVASEILQRPIDRW